MKIAYAFAALALCGSAAAIARPHGSAFLTKAMEGDNSETMLGTIAARRGASPGTRAFGAMLAADHSRAKVEVAALARRRGMTSTDRVAPEASTERRKLAGLHGRAFDREFARYMVDDHRKDIADFTAEAKSRDDGALTALARKTLPVLRKHLAHARSLASR
jgi:putative membrane protein